MSKQAFDAKTWDAEMATKKADYEKLYQTVLQASQESPNEVEVLWRLASGAYHVSLNYTDEAKILAKTQEVLQTAQKVLAIDGDHFQGNLWMAVASGKLALLEASLPSKVK